MLASRLSEAVGNKYEPQGYVKTPGLGHLDQISFVRRSDCRDSLGRMQ